MRRVVYLGIFLIGFLALTAEAALPGFDAPSQPVTARAVTDHSVVPPGNTARIGIEITINSRYHIQSAFAAKPYIAAKATPKPADGIAFGEIQYEKPTEIPSPPALGGGTLSVYERKAYVIVPITVAADAAAGEREVEVALTTQACDDATCLSPKTLHLKATFAVGKPGVAAVAANGDLFDAAGRESFASVPPDASGERGLPEPPPATSSAGAGSGREVQLLSNDRQVALIAQRPYEPGNSGEDQHSLPAILLFALVGGLILNIMPCVLPVIPLKALSFVQQAHGNPRVAMLHGLAFSAGVVGLFMALAVALRTFGLFYGQQFQSPVFLIVMVYFVVALALSMVGVWTINPPQSVYALDARIQQAGAADIQYAGPGTRTAQPGEGMHAHPLLASFGSGVMATLLATPCSAPFLGPVLAYALIQPAWITALMLAVVGIGMSMPYLLLAAFPKLLARVPRAGRWSELLKQGLGIVMLGVAIYLVTLVPDTQLWPWVLVGGIVVSLICWAWGQIPSPLMDRGKIWGIRAGVAVLGTALALGVYLLALRFTPPRAVASASGMAVLPDKADGTWQPFNIALLDAALAQHRPVVVDWTADWCINCRVLEATVLNRDETRAAFLAHNALLLRADLSEDNPPATALNKKLGGEAIPVLAIFSPGEPTRPVVLRDKYSTARVVGELARP